MFKLIPRMGKKMSQSPGALVRVGGKKTGKVNITRTVYNEEKLDEMVIHEIDETLFSGKNRDITWVNLDGIHDIDHIKRIGEIFNIHALVLEDILNTDHRPKVEYFDNYQFVILKMLHYDKLTKQVKPEQISLILGENYVISFHETKGDIFEPIRERLRKGKGRIRKRGNDYLFYILMDTVVDKYFALLEDIGEGIENLEDDLIANPRPEILHALHQLKTELIFLRRVVSPIREVVGSLMREETEFMKKTTNVYLRDIYDHTIHVIETTETYRDVVGGLQDLYLSSVSNKMNEVMKVLTIIATIFIPLTFIAGIYGMNFNTQVSPFNMPELNARFGYIFVWILMILVGAVMVFYFKRKKWL